VTAVDFFRADGGTALAELVQWVSGGGQALVRGGVVHLVLQIGEEVDSAQEFLDEFRLQVLLGDGVVGGDALAVALALDARSQTQSDPSTPRWGTKDCSRGCHGRTVEVPVRRGIAVD
jgi:hypothetical protein